MKIKLLLLFSIVAYSLNAQWTSFITPFSPYNGGLNSINVGSANQLVGIGDDIYGSPYKMAYKFDFTTNSWYLYHDLWPYNLGHASVASDGTVWTAELNGNGIYKNTVTKTGPVMKVIQSRSVNEAVGYNPTQVFYTGNNMNISNASDAFSLQSTLSQINMKSIDIGDDGTIWAINNNPPPYYDAVLFKFIAGDWVAQSTGTSFTDWQSVAVGDVTKVLAVRSGLLYYKDPVTGNFIQDITAPAGVQQASIAADGTVFILANSSNNSNIYRNTWSAILCGTIPAPTYAAGGNSIYICPGNSATFTASGSGTLYWYDSPTSTNVIATGNTFTTPTLTNSAIYYVENDVNGCKSNRVEMYASMSAVPSDPTNTTPAGSLTICPGQSTTLSASAPGPGKQNQWFDNNSGGTLLGTGNSYVVPAGIVNSTTTYYIQTVSLVNGCTSGFVPVTINVSSAPSAPVNTTPAANLTICSGETSSLTVSGTGTINWYTDAAATNLIQTGTTFTTPALVNSATYYTQINGTSCNSAITPIVVVVNQPSYTTQTVSACSSYQWINGQTYTTNNSTATHTLQNAAGCDSIITLNLTILQPSTTSFSAQSCTSYTWNGQTYTSGGTYIQSFTNQSGCDSTVTLNLIVTQPTSSVINESACGSYTLNGQNYTTSGTYTQTLQNAQGCDSTLTLQLTILNPSTSVLNESACSSYNLNGTIYNVSGTYIQTIPNAQGCDSTITLNLTLNNNSSIVTETACVSFDWNGQIYSTSGAYQQIFTNISGCDSIVTLNLTIDDLPNVEVSNINNTLTAIQTEATYQWIDCNNGNAPIANATSQSYTPTSNGSYAVIVSNGMCTETSICQEVTTVGINVELVKLIELYPNPTDDIINISQVVDYRIINLNGEIISTIADSQIIDLQNLPSGVYICEIFKDGKLLLRERIIHK